MKKTEFINIAAKNAHLTRSQMDRAFNSIFSIIENELINEGTITFTGFGSFRKEYREAYTGRNPHTGEAIEVPAKNTVRFKPAKQLKATMNGGVIDDADE